MKNATFLIYIKDKQGRQVTGLAADYVPNWIIKEYLQDLAQHMPITFDLLATSRDDQIAAWAQARGITPRAYIPVSDGMTVVFELIPAQKYSIWNHAGIIKDFVIMRFSHWKRARRLKRAAEDVAKACKFPEDSWFSEKYNNDRIAEIAEEEKKIAKLQEK